MLNPNYKKIILALDEAKTMMFHNTTQNPHAPTPQPRLVASPLLEEISLLEKRHHQLQEEARLHCYTHKQATTLENAIPLLNELSCYCPDQETIINATNKLLNEATQLLEHPNDYQPFPCPHCDIIRWWNMGIHTTKCPACSREVETSEAYRIGVSVARMRLQLAKLKNHLHKRKKK